MKKIISFLLIISLILPILPVYAAGKVINIKHIENDNKTYAFASFSTTATPGTGVLFGTFGWNISFNGYKFLYEIEYNPDISIEYKIPLVDGSGLPRASIQSRIKSRHGESSAIYKAWMNLMETGGTITFNASIHRLDYGVITGPRANTLSEALALADWGSNTRRELEEEYYNREAYVSPQPVKTNEVNAQFKIYYKGSDITNNSSKPAVKDPENMQLILQDTSTVTDNSDPIVEYRWYYWYNGWISLDGMSGVDVTEGRVTIDNMDSDLPGSMPLRKGFKLEVVTESGLESYATADGYFKQLEGDITVYYKDVSTDEDLYAPTYMENLSYGTYTINAKPSPDGYSLISDSTVKVSISATNPSKEVYFFYREESGIEAGTIIAYYKDKVNNADIMTADIYSGLEYGIHQIDAAPAPDKYTLETQSPQMIELSSSQPFKEVFFYYKPDASVHGKPPVADCYAPSPVMAGDEIKVTAKSSYDPDGRIVDYNWDLDNAIPTSNFQGKVSGYVWFEYEGNEEISVTVRDNDGLTSSDYAEIEVLPPIPTAIITYTGTLKENRLVTLSAASSKSPKHYPIDHTKTVWEITPISGGTSNDIKYFGSLNGAKTKDILFKKPGKYSVKLTVYNTYDDGWIHGYSDTTEVILNILPDNPPIANFSVPSKHVRDPEDGNKVRINLQDLSYSDDGDIIIKRIWKGAYDSDNDGKFDDESWIIIDDGNNTSPVVVTNEVGKWKFELEVEEEFGQPTIEAFITEEDKRHSNTLNKNESEKITEVINTAPVVDFEMKKKKAVDMIVVTDYEGQELADLQAALSALKTEINALNLDFKYTIVNNKVKIGIINDALRKYYRYAKYTNVHDLYISGYNGDDWRYDVEGTLKFLWEETSALESEESKLPLRNPKNITWSKSEEYYEETSSHDRFVFDIEISCTNDVKTYESGKYIVSSFSKRNGFGSLKDSIRNEKVTIDRKFSKGEIIQEIVNDLNVLDVDMIPKINLRDGSDRYMVLATNDYYSLGNLTSEIKDYVMRNNFKVKAVMSEAVRDMLVTNEKVWDIKSAFGDIYYFMKNGKVLKTGNESNTGGILYPVDVTEQLADVVDIEMVTEAQAALYYKSNGQVLIQFADSKVIEPFSVRNIKQHKVFVGHTGSGNWYFLTHDNKLYKLSLYNKSLSLINNGSGTYVIDKILAAENTFLTTDGKVVMPSPRYNPFYNVSNGYGWTELEYMYGGPITDIKELTPTLTNKDDVNKTNRILKNDGTVVNCEDEILLSNVKNMIYLRNAVLYEMDDGSYKIEKATYFNYSKKYGNRYKLNTIKDTNLKDIKDIYVYMYNSYKDYSYSGNYSYYYDFVYYILSNDGSLYRYKWKANNPTYYKQPPYYTSSYSKIKNDVKQIGAGLTGLDDSEYYWYSQDIVMYYLFNDGTVEKNGKKIEGLNNVKKIAVPYLINPSKEAETTIVALFYDGNVEGMGYSGRGELGQFNSNVEHLVNPLNNRVVLDDYSKEYIKPNDLISLGVNNNYYDERQYQTALNDVLSEIKAEFTMGIQYILVGEKIDYEAFYNDYENDPKFKQVWRYEHDYNYFDNNLGLAAFSGNDIDSPIESFDKVGKYTVTLKVKDNPKNNDLFDNYRLWNKNNSSMTLYVHRKPVALMNVSLTANDNNRFSISVTDGGSYDLDHMSLPDKGIVEWDWRWKEANEYDWHYEKININDGTSANTYIIMLRVKDMEGAWSDPIYYILDETEPPIAQFAFDKAIITTEELAKIKDTSFAIMSNLTNWHWIVKKINDNGTIGATLQDVRATESNTGSGGYDTTLNITRTNPGVGKYRIYLRVKADNGLWSDGGTDTTPNINNMFYRDLTINQALEIKDISITGRWNHFRGWTDKFGVYKDVMKDVTYVDENGTNRYPYRFLSYEKIDITIKLEGYADKVIIDFPDGLDRMTYTDKLGYTYSYKEDVGYTVSFPYEIEIDPTLKDPEISWSYILPLVDSTVSWDNRRIKEPYTISIKAIKGTYEVIQEKKIDITGNVDDLIFIQPLER